MGEGMEKYQKVFGVVAILAIALIGGVVFSVMADGNADQERTISVTGEGEVTVVPDLAILGLVVEVEDKEVAKAQEMAADAMNDVMTALGEKGVLEKDIQTSGYSIDSRWKGGKDVGYRVKNTVKVKIRDINEIEDIIDAAVKAGGDLTRIEGRMAFGVDDPTPYYKEAREKAVGDAKKKAEQLAELNNMKLGEPISISESRGYAPSYGVYYKTAKIAKAPPISPGEMEIRLTVNIKYEIEE